MIDIRPDAAHPQGGYAVLVLPGDAVQGDSVPVSVRDNYGGRFLGENGFQATQVAFGPYAVERAGADARIVIGPEIVNQIEEYTPVRILVGDAAADVSWPDSVVPAPGAPAIGGIYRAPGATGSALTGTQAPPVSPPPAPARPDPEPAPAPVPAPPEATLAPAQDTPAARAEKPARRLPMIVGLLALLAIGGAAAYLLLMPEEVPTTPVAAAPPPPPPAPTEPCATETLDAAFGTGFAALSDLLRACTTQVSADDALRYVERAADAGDAAALALFGTLYDGERTDPAIETDIGLTFVDAPDRAASYYARAVEAGSDTAADYLHATCTRLEGLSDTLSQGAFADHCAPQ